MEATGRIFSFRSSDTLPSISDCSFRETHSSRSLPIWSCTLVTALKISWLVAAMVVMESVILTILETLRSLLESTLLRFSRMDSSSSTVWSRLSQLILDAASILATKPSILPVSCFVSSARLLICSATTANPLPASPALAASMEAFKASMLVWAEIELMPLMTSFMPLMISSSSCMSFFIWSDLSMVNWDSSTIEEISWLLASISSMMDPAAEDTCAIDSAKPSCAFTTSFIFSSVIWEALTTVSDICLTVLLIYPILSVLSPMARSRALICITDLQMPPTSWLNLSLPSFSRFWIWSASPLPSTGSILLMACNILSFLFFILFPPVTHI